ncbi:MAG TPA: PKD domain-containing protein [Thermoleophilaceae bacterium]
MRRLLTTTLALAVLALPASALAADQGVVLGPGGFDKHEVVIKPSETVTFTNNTLADNVRFEDETSNRCQAPLPMDCSRTFPDAGVFKFYDAAQGCTYDTCAAEYRGIVIVDGPPSVTGLSVPATGTRGQTVPMTASASDPNGDSISSFSWDFGDGGSATTGDGGFNHIFLTAGHFTVTVTATDQRGNISAPVQMGVDIAVPDSDGDGVNDDQDRCASSAGPAPDGCPIAPLIIPPPIASSATAAEALGVKGALKSGVNVVVNCSAACTGFLTLTRGGVAVAAPARATLTGSGTKLVTMRFTSAAKRSLARLKIARLQLQVVVTDSLTRVQTRKATIVLKRVKTIGKLPAIGISDNQAATFNDPNFQVLRLRYARLVSPWNAIFTEPDRLDAWLQGARAHGIRPLVAFEHARGQVCPGKHCVGPSVGQFKRAWRAFHAKYPWVRDISPWNEVNSATQPTGKRPDLAASYYNVVRARCRGCTIVAADLLDASNIRRYVAAFLAKAKGKPRLWGLHNYTDTNRFRSRGTNALLQTVKGIVWLTETGGVVRFVTQKGVVALPKSESRARKAMDYMFRLAEANAKRIKRIYVYQWKVNNSFDRFDAGVVRPDGTPRPSYNVLSLNASIARKR